MRDGQFRPKKGIYIILLV